MCQISYRSTFDLQVAVLVLAALGKFTLWGAVLVDAGAAIIVILNGMRCLRWDLKTGSIWTFKGKRSKAEGYGHSNTASRCTKNTAMICKENGSCCGKMVQKGSAGSKSPQTSCCKTAACSSTSPQPRSSSTGGTLFQEPLTYSCMATPFLAVPLSCIVSRIPS